MWFNAIIMFVTLSLSVISNNIIVSDAQNMKLACLSVKYKDVNRYVSDGQLRTLCNGISNFYKENSRGKLIFDDKQMVCRINLNGNRANTNRAEDLCISQYNKKYGSADRYAVITMFKGYSNANGKIAHLTGAQISTANHEIGHTLELEHSGKYNYKNGKTSYDKYGDSQSVMGRYPSNYLVAPQYHFKKWINENELLYFNQNNITFNKEFTIDKIISKDYTTIKSVILQGFTARDIYISYPIKCTNCISLHFGLRGGSQLIKTIFDNKEYKDIYFSNLSFQITSTSKNGPVTFIINKITNTNKIDVNDI